MVDARGRTSASIHFLLSDAEAEERRAAAVHRYSILDAALDDTFTQLVACAASIMSVPMAGIGVVDSTQIRFKARVGLEIRCVPRDAGLCAATIESHEPLIIPDTLSAPRARSNPLVAGPPAIRFYLGVPLRTPDGFNIATLFVMDRVPRTATPQQVESLQMLASVIMDHLELDLASKRSATQFSDAIAEKDRALTQAALMAREIDHRVMNSLQLVSGILNMQSQAQLDGETKDQLKQAAGRVAAIARVHQHIYLTEGIGQTKCRNYLQRVCKDLSPVLEARGRGAVNLTADDVTLPTARIVAIGLIINELVTNAIKYGQGQVSVDFRVTEDGYALTVGDEGPDQSSVHPPAKGRGFGMTVVFALVTQLHGSLNVVANANRAGKQYVVTFPQEADFPPSS